MVRRAGSVPHKACTSTAGGAASRGIEVQRKRGMCAEGGMRAEGELGQLRYQESVIRASRGAYIDHGGGTHARAHLRLPLHSRECTPWDRSAAEGGPASPIGYGTSLSGARGSRSSREPFAWSQIASGELDPCLEGRVH